MDLMNAVKYMSPVWLAKAPGMMHSQPSQPITISPSVSRPDDVRQSSSSSSVTRPDASNPVNHTKPVDKVDSAVPVSEEQQAKQQQQAFEQVVAQLKSRDREVKAHEQAHLSAAGPYATGGIKYDYQTGPDGQKYAVGGSVGIDTSPVSGDPEATIQKMRVVQAAAMAPAQPSSQDFKVAAQASQISMQASTELQAERAESMASVSDEESPANELVGEDEANSTKAGFIQPRESDQNVNQNINSAIMFQGYERNAFDLRLRLQERVA
jgi:hypothetical protein